LGGGRVAFAHDAVETVSGAFEKYGDLWFSFHFWDELKAYATFTWTDRCCRTLLGKRGLIVRYRPRFLFSDRFDWSAGETTHLPGTELSWPQDWGLELKHCSHVLYGSGPRNFVTVAYQESRGDLERCCPV
jgi:hypothetical protein